jgi:hypothetical protein
MPKKLGCLEARRLGGIKAWRLGSWEAHKEMPKMP